MISFAFNLNYIRNSGLSNDNLKRDINKPLG